MSDHSDSSHSSHPSVSPSHSSNHSDHSMGDWSPQPFHSPLHISLSTPSVSLERYRSSSPRFSLRSSSPSPVHIQDDETTLTPEEDPGSGSVQVQVSDSPTIHIMGKRSLARKSEYFRSYLVRFHTNNMEEQEMSEKMVELNSDFVSSEAWTVIKVYVEFGDLKLTDEVAFEVLQASNYLQMDSVQAETAEYLKNLVSKTNFLTVYDFAVSRGINSLSSYIMSTIIKPAEVMRRRKYGGFDLNLQLGQLVFKCHRSVLSSMSQRIKTVLGEEQMVDGVVDSSSFGISSENSQLFYNVFELVYLGTEEFSIYSFEEAISIFKILLRLKFDYKFIRPCLTSLARLVSLTNYSDIYQTGHEAAQDIALYFLMYRIEQLKYDQFFLTLPLQDCCKIFSHSYLNVPNEFSVVELIFSWLSHQDNTTATQLDSMAMELLGYVRWARLSAAEVELLMKKDMVLNSQKIQSCVKTLVSEKVEEKAREWPKLLLLVEQPPLKDRKVESDETSGPCSVQSYDMDTKIWGWLTDVPEGRGEGYSVTAVQNSLVLTSPNSCVPYLPIAVQTYDSWADSWSRQPQLCKPEEATSEQEHSVVEVQGKVFTVLTPKLSLTHHTMCLHMASGVQTATPLWSISIHTLPHPMDHTVPPHLATTGGGVVHVIGQGRQCASLDTYHPTTQAWTAGHLSSAGDICQAGWVGWAGGLARVGGECQVTKHSSGMCQVFSVVGGDTRHMASLVRDRVRPGLVQFKGMLFAAGGYKQWKEDKKEKKGKNKNNFDIKQVVESSVEYYVPQLDSWNLMRTQPKLSYGRVTMVVVDKPIRMMARGNMSFKLKKGIKRHLVE